MVRDAEASSPTPDALASELRKLTRKGAKPRAILDHPLLLNLASVQAASRTSSLHSPLVSADEFRNILVAVFRTLPPDRRKAAEILFGLDPPSQFSSLRERQERAGALMGLGWETFRRRHQDRLIQNIADELYRFGLEASQAAPAAPLPPPSRKYAVIHQASTYTISDSDLRAHTYRRTMEVEAVRPGVTEVDYWYRWSGHGKQGEPVAKSVGHSIVLASSRDEIWDYYSIKLPYELPVRARERIEIEQELFDSDREFKPYLSSTAREGMESLTLRVVLPIQRLPNKIESQIWNSSGPEADLVSRLSMPVQFNDRNGVIEMTVNDPIPGCRYGIQWSYGDGLGVYPTEDVPSKE